MAQRRRRYIPAEHQRRRKLKKVTRWLDHIVTNGKETKVIRQRIRDTLPNIWLGIDYDMGPSSDYLSPAQKARGWYVEDIAIRRKNTRDPSVGRTFATAPNVRKKVHDHGRMPRMK
jgi:hypothetical protein